MTQAQRTYLMFYPRDDKGEFHLPRAPRIEEVASLERDLKLLAAWRWKIPTDQFEEAKRKVIDKWKSQTCPG